MHIFPTDVQNIPQYTTTAVYKSHKDGMFVIVEIYEHRFSQN
jgi:hypothetical protein